MQINVAKTHKFRGYKKKTNNLLVLILEQNLLNRICLVCICMSVQLKVQKG